MPDVLTYVLMALQGTIVGAVVLLVFFIAIAVLVGRRKLRRGGRAGARNHDELVGGSQTRFLRPDDPHGPIDQLKAGTSGKGIA
jgi:hypothetical protein